MSESAHPDIPVVYAMSRALIPAPNGTNVLVAKGSHWPADDPLVLSRPQMFSADPRWGMHYTQEPAGYSAPVSGSIAETATATPGEKRAAGRRG
jgi:hypothetical protein